MEFSFGQLKQLQSLAPSENSPGTPLLGAPLTVKTVIDKKVKAWTGTEYGKYLTPTTLFGDKFEKYLNQKVLSEKTRYKNNYELPKLRFNNFTGREYDYDELEKKLLGW